MQLARQFLLCLIFFISIGLNAIYANQLVSELRKDIPLFYRSFKAAVQLVYDDGQVVSGVMSYTYPNKMHLQQSNGSVIATNGTQLWLYSKQTDVCIRQDIDEGYGGITGYLGGFNGTKTEAGYQFERESGYYRKIMIKANDGMLQIIRLETQEKSIQLKFSNIQEVKSFKASLFNFKPSPNTQLLENPLKR